MYRGRVPSTRSSFVASRADDGGRTLASAREHLCAVDRRYFRQIESFATARGPLPRRRRRLDRLAVFASIHRRLAGFPARRKRMEALADDVRPFSPPIYRKDVYFPVIAVRGSDDEKISA